LTLTGIPVYFLYQIKEITVTKEELLEEFKSELENDIGDWCPSDEEDVISWSESCLDVPSNSVINLLHTVSYLPEDQQDEIYEEIDEIISTIVDDVIEELDEDEEDDE